MNPIRILNSNLQVNGEIDNYESLQFIRRWQKPGEFELHININKAHTDKLIEDNLIMLGNGQKIGVIRHAENTLDDKGNASDELLVKGTTLQGLIGRRITVPPAGQGYDRASGPAEAIIKQYVYNNCVYPADPKRVIQALTVASYKGIGKLTVWQTRFEPLDAVLQDISEFCDMGWDITLDIPNFLMVFEVLEGRELTAGQSLLPPVIFSTDFENVKSQHYVNSALNYKNVGYAGGQGDEEARLIQVIGDASGLSRIETFLDCSQAADADELVSLGEQKLAELKKVQTFEMGISPTNQFIYEKDWDLGDKVTLQSKKWGITMDSRITEVKEIYEASGFSLEATFGNNIPTLIDKLKKNTKRTVR